MALQVPLIDLTLYRAILQGATCISFTREFRRVLAQLDQTSDVAPEFILKPFVRFDTFEIWKQSVQPTGGVVEALHTT